MAIDFSFPEDVELVRHKVREFIAKLVRPPYGGADASFVREVVVNRVIGCGDGALFRLP